MDPTSPVSDASKMSFWDRCVGERAKPKAGRKSGPGQGVRQRRQIMSATELIARFKREYDEASIRRCESASYPTIRSRPAQKPALSTLVDLAEPVIGNFVHELHMFGRVGPIPCGP